MHIHRFPQLVPGVLLISAAAAQIVVPAGFHTTIYPIGSQVTGLDLAPPGPFDERLYLSVSGSTSPSPAARRSVTSST